MTTNDTENDHIPSISSKNFKKWKKVRQSTLIIFIVQNFLIGADSSFLFMSLLMYLKTYFGRSNLNLFYTLANFSTILPSLLIVNLVSTYADRTRNIRLIFFITNSLVIIGNILYIFPLSPWTILIARLLSGTCLLTRSIMNGEVARSYVSATVPSKVSMLGFFYMLGFAAGPAINFLLLKVRFSISSLELSYLNLPGLLMAALFFLIQICSIFMLGDLSKIYDLKDDIRKCKEENDDVTDENKRLLSNDEHDENETKGKWRKILTNIDILVILYSTFVQNFILSSLYTWLPMVIIERLRWSVASLGWVNMSIAILTVLPLIFLSSYQISNQRLYQSSLFTQFAFIICQIVITVQYFVQDVAINIVLWILYCFMIMFAGISDEVFFVGVLAQMVSSEYQIFADGVRLTSYRIASGIACFIASFTFEYMIASTTVQIFLLLASLIFLILRRRTLQNPSISIY